jgi:hypothetical protein
MEAALWTYNLTNAIVNGGRASSSSRAAIKAWIEVDGHPMEPGMVVYADRLAGHRTHRQSRLPDERVSG